MKRLALILLLLAARPAWGATGTPFPPPTTPYTRSILDDVDATTARSTLGLGTIATQAAGSVSITGGSIAGITDIAVADGGTGGSTASAARTNLGVAIGSDVQAFDNDLTTWGGVTPATGGATWITTPNAANFAAFQTGETGTGAPVLGTGPTIDAGNFTTSVNLGEGAKVAAGSVQRVEPDGDVFNYAVANANAAAVGTAMITAQTAAASGDTINVYADATVTGTLGKNGVNWKFAKVTITKTTASVPLWADGAAEMDFTVTGDAAFVTTGDDSKVVYPTSTSSDWTFYCRSIQNQHTNADAPAIASLAATCRVFASESVRSEGYDAIWNRGVGLLEVHAPEVYGKDDGIEVEGGGTTNVYCDTLGGGEVTILAGFGNATVYVDCKKRAFVDGASASGQVISVDASGGAVTLTVNCPDMTGSVQSLSGAAITLNGPGVLTGNVSAAGPITMRGITVDSNAISGPAILLSGASSPATLQNCSFLDNGATAITGSASSTIANSGTLSTNKAISSNVTVTGGTVVVSGKTLTVSNSYTTTATDGSTVAFGAGGTVLYSADINGTGELAGITDYETGSGALVFATSPTLVTPILGVAAATSINKVAITAPATSSTITVADGKTFTASNTLTFTGTDSSTLNVGAGGTLGALATVTPGTGVATAAAAAVNATGGLNTNTYSTTADTATVTPVGSSIRNFHEVSALAQAMTIAAPSGTPANGYGLIVRIKDNGTTRALTWNAIYANAGVAMPTNTTAGKWHTVGFIYNSTASKWQCTAAVVEP